MKRFITFEGGEAAGKTTQIAMLAHYLQKQGQTVITTREPGGTPEGEALRHLLLEGEKDRWDGLSETLLMAAARREHCNKVIKPALDQGAWVLCDRFVDSSFVYQGDGKGIAKTVITQINQAVLEDCWPERTFVLDLSLTTSLERQKQRAAKADRFESLGQYFHERLRQGFLALTEDHPDRCQYINADQSPEKVFADILGYLEL